VSDTPRKAMYIANIPNKNPPNTFSIGWPGLGPLIAYPMTKIRPQTTKTPTTKACVQMAPVWGHRGLIRTCRGDWGMAGRP